MQRRSGLLTFLHGDHLNSTVLATRGGASSGQERYYAYGKDRLATPSVPADNRFTGQKEDASGLVYMNAKQVFRDEKSLDQVDWGEVAGEGAVGGAVVAFAPPTVGLLTLAGLALLVALLEAKHLQLPKPRMTNSGAAEKMLQLRREQKVEQEQL